MFKRNIILLISLFCIINLSAQYTIEGTIIDSEQRPICNANITLLRNDSIKHGASSDDYGHFMMKEVSSGDITLQISHLNYMEGFRVFHVTQNTDLDSITLLNKSYTLEGISVNKNRRFISSKMNKLSYKIPKIINNSSTSIYQVLQHIPNVNSNIFERTIEVNGRSNLYIEVNGIHRSMDYLSNIKPDEIIEIELIENPTGKYLSKDVSAVINVITKSKQRGYSGYLGTKQSPPLTYGLTYGAFQYNTPKVSVNISGQNFFFDEKNHNSNRVIKTNNSMAVKQSNDYPFYYLGNNLNLGIDYKISQKSIILLEYINEYNNYSLGNVLNGFYYENDILTNETISEREDESTTKNNSYVLHYQFKRENSLLNVNMEYNDFESSYFNNYTETFPNYIYTSNQDFDNNKLVKSLFVDYEFLIDKIGTVEVGTRLNHQETKLEGTYANNVTDHFKLEEERYVSYVTVSGIKLLSGNLQLGADFDYSKITINSNTNNNYFFVLPNFTFLLKPNKQNTINLNYRLSRNSPAIQSLNPHQRFTDGMKVHKGNPYLEPYYYNTLQLKYNFSKGSFFIAPEIGYSFTNNYIAQIGKIDANGIYQVSYDNIADYNMFHSNIQFGGNAFKWWRIKSGIILQRNSYKDGGSINRSLFSYGFSCQNTFFYKKASININVSKKSKELNSNMEYINPIESSAYLQWKVNDWFSVNGGLRYLIPWEEKFEIKDNDYSESYKKEINERNNLIVLGLNIYLQNGKQAEKRNRKKYERANDAQMKERK